MHRKAINRREKWSKCALLLLRNRAKLSENRMKLQGAVGGESTGSAMVHVPKEALKGTSVGARAWEGWRRRLDAACRVSQRCRNDLVEIYRNICGSACILRSAIHECAGR